MSVGIGLFFPMEQELTRIVAARAVCGEGAAPVLRKAGLLTAGVLAVVLGALALFAGPIADRLFPGDQALVAVLGAALTGMALCYLTRGVLAAPAGSPRTAPRSRSTAVCGPFIALLVTLCPTRAATRPGGPITTRAAPARRRPPRRARTSHLVLDGRVRTRFLNKDDTPPADATESRHNPGRPARRPGRPRARVRDLAPRPIPAPRESRNGWTPAAPAGVHPFSVRLFHAHLTREGPGGRRAWCSLTTQRGGVFSSARLARYVPRMADYSSCSAECRCCAPPAGRTGSESHSTRRP